MILCQPHRDSGLVRNRQQCNKWVTIASLTPLPILRVLEVFASSRRKMSVWPTPSKYFKTNLGSLLFGQMGVRQSFFRVDQGLKYGMIWQIYSSTIKVYSNFFALNKHSNNKCFKWPFQVLLNTAGRWRYLSIVFQLLQTCARNSGKQDNGVTTLMPQSPPSTYKLSKWTQWNL